MKNINIAELLKDCPKGMELYSPLCGDCKLYDVNDYTIRIETPNKDTLISLHHDGRYCSDGEIMLFPKGKTTWEGFQRPFISGDILINKNESIFIYKGPIYYNKMLTDFYCVYRTSDGAFISKNFNDNRHCGHLLECRFATEKEKQKLFQVIKDNGYKWNIENKILEKLPRFKVGDRIILKDNPHNTPSIKIKSVTKSQYILENEGFFYINSADEKYVLENKFDITTLKPFESRVLVRDNDFDNWKPSFWGYLRKCEIMYDTVRGVFRQCIPYEGNEHLLSTTNDCDEFYKTWEK